MLAEGNCDLVGVGAGAGGVGCVPYFNYTLAFALQMREVTENLSRVFKKL